MRNFDVGQQFEAIKQAASEAVKSIFPVEGKTRVMRLEGVSVEDKLDSTDYSQQSKVKAQNGTWGVPVYASLALYDKASGNVIDRAPKVRLFLLPKITPRYSYIVGGNEYQVTNQLRLKSGVYTLRKQNGELKTTVNLAAGKNFDLMFKESNGQFTITKIGGGQANIPLYPVLTHLGVSASDIERAWGSAIAAANRSADQKILSRANTAFGIRQGDLKDYFEKTKLNPETTKLTLGQGFDRVSGPMLLAASKKLLDVHMGKKEPEDRDSLEFKELHSLEDFIKERLEKNKEALAFKIKRSIDSPTRTKITQIVNPGAFNSVIESFFTQDDKSSTPEQTNPLEMVSGLYKATIMGSGGIKSQHAITDEMRNIHPTHYGFLDPIHTPESDRIGANLHIPIGAVKDGNELKMAVKDRQGKTFYLTPAEAYNAVIAFPGQKGTKIEATHRGKTITVPASQVQYYTPAPQGLFSVSTNLVPYLPANQGNRAMMAAKMLEQAISLKKREAPLVQVGTPGGGSTMEQLVGNEAAVKAPEDGIVTKITDEAIYVGRTKVNLYNYFALNRKSYIHNEPIVKVGDRVKKGQVIADSNYTKNGTLALGVNLKAAYVPYQGYNFEDGIVITDSAAEKLTSVHIHKKDLSIDENIITGLGKFTSQYPNALTGDNLRKLDESGVIKKGQTVQMGDAVIAALQKRQLSQDIGVVQRALADRPKDVSVYWTQEDPGVVMDVQKSGKNVTVFIRTEEKAKIGDKLAGRMGNKGIITKIIPDHEAPKDSAGKAVDILLNPHGVISRINIGQIYESAGGKVAEKTGKPVVVKNFTGENYLTSTKELLDKHKVTDKEELFDANGKSIGKVHVGNPYILKLFKQSTGNFSVRQGGPGNAYDINEQPLKAGGEESAKSLDLLTMYSMLSHGARANLREMSAIKSNQNDEFWTALKSGQMLPPPKAPFVYDKFLTYLKGAGVDTKKDGSKVMLSPLLDEEVKKQSSGQVDRVAFYRGKDMEPIRGGFFDPVKFGGFKGTKWGHIELKEPQVNPVFETAIKKITGLGTKYDDIMAGKLHYKDGEFNRDAKGVTGGAALEQILKKIDVDKEINDLMKKSSKVKGGQLDDLNKKLRYLQALKVNDLKPHEAYIRRFVPIVPPVYRPLYSLPDGNITSSDINFLYQNLGILNTMHRLPVVDMLPEEEKADLRKDTYEHLKGISGLTDLNIKGRPREGFISAIKGGVGGQPKEGLFIAKVLSKRQDFVGRGTIIPEPSLGVDEVALPEAMAWKLFEPFVIRELGRSGKTPNQAIDEIKNKSELAKRALQIVMKDRHVMLNRAPSLHKFSIMAFKPTITTGTAIKIPPLVVKGFNADFDGDTMTVHVPITDEANKEAQNMLPSRNLYQPGTGKLMISPSQEAQIGIFYLSKTDAGRKRLNQILGSKHSVSVVLDKKETGNLLARLSKELAPSDFARVMQQLKAEGEKHSFERGFTLGIDDLVMFGQARDKVVSTVDAMAKKAKTQGELMKINELATGLVNKMLDARLKNKDNSLYDMVDSGARGSKDQLRAIMVSPLFVADAKGRVVPTAIKKSYAEGLDVSDYWTSMYGARRGMMDRAIQTSLPGAFSKDIMANTIDNVISAIDCGTKKGVSMSTDDRGIVDRFLAGNQGTFSHNTLIDSTVAAKLKKEGLKTVQVRSPLTCMQSKGTCAKCYGLDEAGHVPAIGENVGAKAGQTISEPLVQMVMNCSEGTVTDTDGNIGAFVDLYESLDVEETFDGKCYSKHGGFNALKDDDRVVRSGIIQTHPADDKMVFLKTKTGHTMLVQKNHPVWVYRNGEAQEVAAGEVSVGDAFKVCKPSSGEVIPPVDGYVAGIFLAEGSTRYGNGTKKYENRAVASIITQYNGDIKRKAFSFLQQTRGATFNDLDIQVYNPEFAAVMSDIVRGREAKLKRLKPGFNRWHPSYQADLLAGWIDGDGTAFYHHGITVAQVYTSSFVALQQLEVLCHQLNIRFTPQVVPRQPKQKSVQFVAQLRFSNDMVYKNSVKLQKLGPLKVGKYKIKHAELEQVTYIKELWHWDLPVWDVKTESRGFTCGMLRNHNTFHTGGAAGTGADVGGYKRIDQLLKLPKFVAGSATLAPKTGIVTKIDKGLAGGFDISIGDTKCHVSQGRVLKVKIGDKVEAGDALSDGVVKPQDLVKHKGMQQAQEYIVGELHKAYKDQGVNLHRKVFETVVRSLGNTTQVLNNPKGADFLPGDIAPYNVVKAYNDNLEAEVPIDETQGMTLAKAYGPIAAGTELTAAQVRALKVAGYKTLRIKRDPIKHAPMLKGITALPLMRKNWMSALGYRNLARALVEGAGQSWSTDLEDYHPIPAFAHGATFGKGKEGKY